MKKIFCAILALSLTLALSACSSSSDSSSSSSAYDTATPTVRTTTESVVYAEESAMDTGAGYSDSAVIDDSKIIVTVYYDAEATDFTTATAQLESTLSQVGGYAEVASVGGEIGYRYASYTLRVPTEALPVFTSQLGDLCHVLYTETTQENVSEIYFDTESRLTTLQTTYDRLISLLESAENMEDIITIETKLSEVTYQIEALTGTLRGYDNLINYATIHINLNEVRDLSVINQQPTFGEEIKTAFLSGGQSVVNFGQNLLLLLIYNWGFLVVVGAIGGGCTLFVRRKAKKRAQKRAQAQDAES